MMKSARRGTPTSGAEVTNISTNGFWLLIDNQEVLLALGDFPWFEHATIREIGKVERPSAQHLYWPALDIDLAVDSLHHPGAYPLVSKGAKQARPERTRSGRTGGRKSPRRA